MIDKANFANQISNIERHLEQVKIKNSKKQDIIPDITNLINEIKSCHKSLEPGQITLTDPQPLKKLKSILQSLNINVNDKSVQEKVSGLVAALHTELTALELKLDEKQWKVGQKVEKSGKSKGG